MEQLKKISKMCDAKVKLTWPGFVEEPAPCRKTTKLKKKRKKKSAECEEPGEGDEEGEECKKRKKLECEACTEHTTRGNMGRAALWCCTRCALMCCGAMRMFVAAAGVLGLCLTMFFIFAPHEKEGVTQPAPSEPDPAPPVPEPASPGPDPAPTASGSKTRGPDFVIHIG